MQSSKQEFDARIGCAMTEHGFGMSLLVPVGFCVYLPFLALFCSFLLFPVFSCFFCLSMLFVRRLRNGGDRRICRETVSGRVLFLFSESIDWVSAKYCKMSLAYLPIWGSNEKHEKHEKQEKAGKGRKKQEQARSCSHNHNAAR
jgi:hypothetical protein